MSNKELNIWKIGVSIIIIYELWNVYELFIQKELNFQSVHLHICFQAIILLVLICKLTSLNDHIKNLLKQPMEVGGRHE